MWSLENATFRLGLKYSPNIFLIFSGLGITDGRSYIFTHGLWDFSTLPTTEKHHSLCRAEQYQDNRDAVTNQSSVALICNKPSERKGLYFVALRLDFIQHTCVTLKLPSQELNHALNTVLTIVSNVGDLGAPSM